MPLVQVPDGLGSPSLSLLVASESLPLPLLDHWAELKARFHSGMNQQKQLSAPEGGSIRIPFFFYYSQDSGRVSNVKISWRWKHFHGDFIYKTTPRLIHKNFENRLLLNWEEGMKKGSLQISNLRREDEGSYFCRVEMITEKYGEQKWQSIQGTELTITHGESSCPA